MTSADVKRSSTKPVPARPGDNFSRRLDFRSLCGIAKKHGFHLKKTMFFLFSPLIFTLRHCMLYTRKQVCLGTIFYTGPSSGLLYIVLPLSITPAFFFCTRSDLALPERALRRSILQSRTQVRFSRLALAKHARPCEIAPDSRRLVFWCLSLGGAPNRRFIGARLAAFDPPVTYTSTLLSVLSCKTRPSVRDRS